MRSTDSKRLLVALAGALILSPAGSALAGIHTWDVNEVFSNADGSIQYVELWEANGTPGETGVGNGSLSSNTESFAIGAGPVVGPTTNKFYLVATQAFADLPGAPAPDAIMPPGVLPFFFDPAGDTVSFVGFDSWSFGAVPTNGTDSLDRFTGAGAATPTNYAGETGSLAPAADVVVPLLSGPMLLALALGLLALAAFAAVRRQRTDTA